MNNVQKAALLTCLIISIGVCIAIIIQILTIRSILTNEQLLQEQIVNEQVEITSQEKVLLFLLQK